MFLNFAGYMVPWQGRDVYRRGRHREPKIPYPKYFYPQYPISQLFLPHISHIPTFFTPNIHYHNFQSPISRLVLPQSPISHLFLPLISHIPTCVSILADINCIVAFHSNWRKNSWANMTRGKHVHPLILLKNCFKQIDYFLTYYFV